MVIYFDVADAMPCLVVLHEWNIGHPCHANVEKCNPSH